MLSNNNCTRRKIKVVVDPREDFQFANIEEEQSLKLERGVADKKRNDDRD